MGTEGGVRGKDVLKFFFFRKNGIVIMVARKGGINGAVVFCVCVRGTLHRHIYLCHGGNNTSTSVQRCSMFPSNRAC